MQFTSFSGSLMVLKSTGMVAAERFGPPEDSAESFFFQSRAIPAKSGPLRVAQELDACPTAGVAGLKNAGVKPEAGTARAKRRVEVVFTIGPGGICVDAWCWW